jgi:hypothetical protein
MADIQQQHVVATANEGAQPRKLSMRQCADLLRARRLENVQKRLSETGSDELKNAVSVMEKKEEQASDFQSRSLVSMDNDNRGPVLYGIITGVKAIVPKAKHADVAAAPAAADASAHGAQMALSSAAAAPASAPAAGGGSSSNNNNYVPEPRLLVTLYAIGVLPSIAHFEEVKRSGNMPSAEELEKACSTSSPDVNAGVGFMPKPDTVVVPYARKSTLYDPDRKPDCYPTKPWSVQLPCTVRVFVVADQVRVGVNEGAAISGLRNRLVKYIPSKPDTLSQAFLNGTQALHLPTLDSSRLFMSLLHKQTDNLNMDFVMKPYVADSTLEYSQRVGDEYNRLDDRAQFMRHDPGDTAVLAAAEGRPLVRMLLGNDDPAQTYLRKNSNGPARSEDRRIRVPFHVTRADGSQSVVATVQAYEPSVNAFAVFHPDHWKVFMHRVLPHLHFCMLLRGDKGTNGKLPQIEGVHCNAGFSAELIVMPSMIEYPRNGLAISPRTAVRMLTAAGHVKLADVDALLVNVKSQRDNAAEQQQLIADGPEVVCLSEFELQREKRKEVQRVNQGLAWYLAHYQLVAIFTEYGYDELYARVGALTREQGDAVYALCAPAPRGAAAQAQAALPAEAQDEAVKTLATMLRNPEIWKKALLFAVKPDVGEHDVDEFSAQQSTGSALAITYKPAEPEPEADVPPLTNEPSAKRARVEAEPDTTQDDSMAVVGDEDATVSAAVHDGHEQAADDDDAAAAAAADRIENAMMAT